MGIMSRAMGMASRRRRATPATPASGGMARRPRRAGGGKGLMAGKAFRSLRGRGKI